APAPWKRRVQRVRSRQTPALGAHVARRITAVVHVQNRAPTRNTSRAIRGKFPRHPLRKKLRIRPRHLKYIRTAERRERRRQSVQILLIHCATTRVSRVEARQYPVLEIRQRQPPGLHR